MPMKHTRQRLESLVGKVVCRKNLNSVIKQIYGLYND